MNLLRQLTMLVVISTSVLAAAPCFAQYQKNISGYSPEKVKENAFKQGMNYPVGEMRCSQSSCSQWWER